jgi:hypothetical protein
MSIAINNADARENEILQDKMKIILQVDNKGLASGGGLIAKSGN